MGGNRQLRMVRIALLVLVIGAGVVFHRHGSTYSAIRTLYYVVIIALIGAAIWRTRIARRGPIGQQTNRGVDDGRFGPPPSGYGVGRSTYPQSIEQSAGIPEGPPEVAPLEAESLPTPPASPPPAPPAVASPPPAPLPPVFEATAAPPVDAASSAPAPSVPERRAAAAAPGWYPDPEDAARRHYWDGLRWTEQVRWDGKGWIPAESGQSA